MRIRVWKRNKIVVLMTGVILLVLALVYYGCSRVTLLGPEEEVLWSARVSAGADLIFEYSHSVEKVPVLEYYQLNRQGGFLLRETRFSSHGAGLPLDEGQFRVEEGVFVVEELNRLLPEIVIRVSRTPGQRLRAGKREVVLQDVAEPGQRVRVVVNKER